MDTRTWPLFALRIETPRLVLRPPTDDDFDGLCDAIDAGIHPPEVMPFDSPWTDAAPSRRRIGAALFWWRTRAMWQPDDWHLTLAAFVDGQPIGMQGVMAQRFGVLREVTTGSWLTQRAQGTGYGTEMRAAVLSFAFRDLAAEVARSGAYADNGASITVSRRLGYTDNGTRRAAPRGTPKEVLQFELRRDAWATRAAEWPSTVHGFEVCRGMFGIE